MKFVKLLFVAALVSGTAAAQTAVKEAPPKNWHLLDPSTGHNGISLDKAYSALKATGLKSNRVVVAVIDSGIDTLHEDLKPVLWKNPGEIPHNGIDDDKNGYVDDVHGWNFIGGKDGRNVKEDTYEAARVYYNLKSKWEGRDIDASSLSGKEKEEYETYLRAKEAVAGGVNMEEVAFMKQLLPKFLRGDSVIRKELGKEEYNANDLEKYASENQDARNTRMLIMNISKANNSNEITNTQLIDDINGQLRKAEAADKPPVPYRKDIVGDDETDINDRFYGNNDLMASTPFHGTHVAGIIAAARNNNKGIDGVADNVAIMVLRAVPDGDEHDKDIALAIRYAVDNGAKIISMSFGKDFSPEKHWVDDAFRYAESKGVLLVHAAGNSAKNIDSTHNYPNPVYVDGSGRASNVITVGAAGDMKNGGLTASFSNYGKSEVDVFAPGVGIYSTIPGGTTYGNASGTSMAAPVVSGVAALIMQYYPNLSAQQVKYAIEKSAVAPKVKVKKPGTDEEVDLSELSKTGGFLNAHEAVKIAGTLKPEKKKEVLPKTQIKKNTKG